MQGFSKDYSSLWGFGVKDVDAINFIEKVKRSGKLESCLPMVFTLTESNTLIASLEQETEPDVESGECPLCEAVQESMTLLNKLIHNSEVSGHPIPERFLKRKEELYNIYLRLDHRKETYLHPLTAKSRFSAYVDKNNQDIADLINSFSYTTESNATVDAVTGIKDENKFVKEIAEKKFANAFVQLLDSADTPDIKYDPQTAGELISGINKLISLSNVCTLLESKRVDTLGVSESLRAILENENTASADDNTREVVANKEVPKQFITMSDKVIKDLKTLARDHQVEKLTNNLYSKFINILKYAALWAVGGTVAPALTGLAILTAMLSRKHVDIRTRQKMIRDLETEQRVIQSRINDVDKDEKYQLMRLETKIQHSIDKLKNRNMSSDFNVNNRNF